MSSLVSLKGGRAGGKEEERRGEKKSQSQQGVVRGDQTSTADLCAVLENEFGVSDFMHACVHSCAVHTSVFDALSPQTLSVGASV